MKINKTKNKINGLFVLGSLYPYVTGGMEIFNYYFLRRLLEDDNYNIYYLGYEKTDSLKGNFVPLKKLWPARIFYPLQFIWTIYRLRKSLDYAYICYAEQSWVISFMQGLTLRFFKIPYIVTNHWGQEPNWKFSPPYIYFFRHARAVIGVSEPICIAFKKVIPDQDFAYIPPLIPFQGSDKAKQILKTQMGYVEQEKIFLFVGSLKPMKNPDKIVGAFRIIGRDFLNSHNIRLIFAGTGEMKNALKDQVEKYELGGYIRFAGLINRESIPDYYKIADFYIISSDYEGTSLSLMEAMFNRLAIIASDAPGINRMLQHEWNALLYETTSTEKLADTLKRIITDPRLANKLSENAYSDFNIRYSYESMIERYKSIFSTV